MHHISKATDVIFFPARTAFAVANVGVRTTVRVVGWAAEQALGQVAGRSTPTVTVPEPRQAEPRVDPMEATQTPPPTAVAPATKAPAKKVPASQVPPKSAPTPSMPAGVEELDEAAEAVAPPTPAATKAPVRKASAKKAAAKKTAAKKAPAKKAPAQKAPSKKAAVLAPALGLSEDEVERS